MAACVCLELSHRVTCSGVCDPATSVTFLISPHKVDAESDTVSAVLQLVRKIYY